MGTYSLALGSGNKEMIRPDVRVYSLLLAMKHGSGLEGAGSYVIIRPCLGQDRNMSGQPIRLGRGEGTPTGSSVPGIDSIGF